MQTPVYANTCICRFDRSCQRTTEPSSTPCWSLTCIHVTLSTALSETGLFLSLHAFLFWVVFGWVRTIMHRCTKFRNSWSNLCVLYWNFYGTDEVVFVLVAFWIAVSSSGRVSCGSTGRKTAMSWWSDSVRASSATATSTWDSTAGWSSLRSLTASTSHSPRRCPWSSAEHRPVLPVLARPRRPRTLPRHSACSALSPTVVKAWTTRLSSLRQ